MSHFAEIKDGIVQKIVVAEQDFIDSGKVGNPSNWIQTSYNHAFRKQFAGVGYTYDSVNDVFINPQPYSSWTLDSSYDWQPPIEKPVGRSSTWNEETQSWD